MASGSVQYTNRAFEQDGDFAMRGDIVRALVELITNADDAYRGQRGVIRIVVDRNDEDEFPLKVSVTDAAIGMSLETMREKFTVIGGDNDAFVNEQIGRGLLGRGAKDVASLGRVEFESIKDGKYSKLTVKRNGDWTDSGSETDATQIQMDELGLHGGQSGLLATMLLRASVKVPKTNELIARLSANAQLRELLERCDVKLVDRRKNQINADILFAKPESTTVINKEIQVPGYEGVANIELRILATPSEKTLSTDSVHGVLVKSEKTIYENTLFGLESKPYANLIAGIVTAPEINTIIREYIRTDDGSGTSLISRSRDGLVAEHPYRKALWRACASEVGELLQAIEQERAKTDGQGEKLTRELKDAASALAQEFSRIKEEIEGEADNSGAEYVDADLDLVPGRLTLGVNTSQTVSVRVKPEFAEQISASVASGDSSISVSVPENTVWREHPRLPLLVSNFVVTAGSETESSVLIVRVGEKSAALDINVRVPGSNEILPPTALEILPAISHISPTRNKKLLIRAPIEFADHEIQILVTGVPIVSHPTNVILRPSGDGAWAQSHAKFQTGVELGRVEIRAVSEQLGEAVAQVEVTESRAFGGANFEIKLHRGDRTARRAVMYPEDDGSYVIRINTDHPASNGIFGRFIESEGKYEFEESDRARLLISEICAQVLSENLVELDSLKRPAHFQDAQSYFTRSNELAAKFVTIVFRALKADV